MKFALIAAVALVASPPFAKAKRHCVSADGSEISDAGTKKQCNKAHAVQQGPRQVEEDEALRRAQVTVEPGEPAR